MSIISISTVVLIFLMVLGALLGFLRGWAKSLARLGIVAGCFLFSFFLAPVFASLLMDNFVSGFVLTVFSQKIDFEQIASSIINNEETSNVLISSSETTAKLANALMHIVVNVVMFLLVFIVISLLAYIIYGIVVFVLSKTRKSEKPEKDGKYWGLKGVGGVIGLVGGVIVAFVFMVPVFGAMNICNKFIQEESASANAVAVAYDPVSTTCGKLYYTEDKNIGGVETYVSKYEEFKNKYDKSFIGGLFNFTGLSKLGAKTFDKLTIVDSDGMELDLSNEIVSMINVYNAYKNTFKKQSFNLADAESVDGLETLYNMATNSEIVKGYLTELVPNICEKWLAGEKYLGITFPISGDFEPLAKDLLKVLNTKSFSSMDENLKAIIGAIKVANQNGFILSIQEKKPLLEYFKNSDSFVEDEINELAKADDIQKVFPDIINDFMTIAHKELVKQEFDYSVYTLTQEELDRVNWQAEASTIQELTTTIVGVYEKTKDSTNSDVLIDCLKDVGATIDSARTSVLISRQTKKLLISYIESKNFELDALVDSINEHWDDENYKFEDMFDAIGKTAKLAQSISNNTGSLNMEELGSTLESVLFKEDGTVNSAVKEELKSLVASDTVQKLVGTSEEATVLTDMLDTLLDSTTKEDVQKNITAGEAVVKIINNNKNDGGIKLDGETEAEKQASAKEIIENIAGSDDVMGLLEDASNQSGSALKNMASGKTGNDYQVFVDSIDSANISESQKQILKNLFS